MREFISAEITHNIIDQNVVIFGMVNERILEILGDHVGGAYIDIMGVQSLCSSGLSWG